MKEENYNNPWSLKSNMAVLVLTPAAVGTDYIGKLFAGILRLPPRLDSIGTCLAAHPADSAVGAIAGATNNLICGLIMSPISMVYIPSRAALGIVVGLILYYSRMKNLRGIISTGVSAGLAAVIVPTPLNTASWEGTTGNLWGDIIYAGALSQGLPAWITSTADEIVMDLLGKIVALLLMVEFYGGSPKSILFLYQSNSEVESLD